MRGRVAASQLLIRSAAVGRDVAQRTCAVLRRVASAATANVRASRAGCACSANRVVRGIAERSNELIVELPQLRRQLWHGPGPPTVLSVDAGQLPHCTSVLLATKYVPGMQTESLMHAKLPAAALKKDTAQAGQASGELVTAAAWARALVDAACGLQHTACTGTSLLSVSPDRGWKYELKRGAGGWGRRG